MTPMLARTLGPKFDKFPCFGQPKLNGVRMLYQNGTGQTRDEKLIFMDKIPQIVKDLDSIQHLFGDSILDGELYVHGWRLQRINGAVSVNSKQITEDSLKLRYHIFDIVDPNRTFAERWIPFYLKVVQEKLPFVEAVSTGSIMDRNDLNIQFNIYVGFGYEGIMLRPNGPYEFCGPTHRRSQYLWKHKAWQDSEFQCLGTTPGEGKASIGIGALVLDCAGGSFKVGTGFDDNDRIEYARNPPIGKLVKIRYLELTTDGIPFNPSFLCVI